MESSLQHCTTMEFTCIQGLAFLGVHTRPWRVTELGSGCIIMFVKRVEHCLALQGGKKEWLKSLKAQLWTT